MLFLLLLQFEGITVRISSINSCIASLAFVRLLLVYVFGFGFLLFLKFSYNLVIAEWVVELL